MMLAPYAQRCDDGRTVRCSDGRPMRCPPPGCVFTELFPYIQRRVTLTGIMQYSVEEYADLRLPVGAGGENDWYVTPRQNTPDLCAFDSEFPLRDVPVICDGAEVRLPCEGWGVLRFSSRNLSDEIPGSNIGTVTAASVGTTLHVWPSHRMMLYPRDCPYQGVPIDLDPKCYQTYARVIEGCGQGAAHHWAHPSQRLGAAWFNQYTGVHPAPPLSPDDPLQDVQPATIAPRPNNFLGEAQYWVFFDRILNGQVTWDVLHEAAAQGRLYGRVRQFGSLVTNGVHEAVLGLSGSAGYHAVGDYQLVPQYVNPDSVTLAWMGDLPVGFGPLRSRYQWTTPESGCGGYSGYPTEIREEWFTQGYTMMTLRQYA